MDQRERIEIFDRLVETLQQNGLGWIVDQVDEEIHVGKTVFKEVDTVIRIGETDELILDPGRAPSGLKTGPKAQFPATVEYDDREKLILLLEGITQAVNALEMENEILEEMKTVGGPFEITFYSEASGTKNIVITPGRITARGQHLGQFKDLMSKLREEVEKD